MNLFFRIVVFFVIAISTVSCADESRYKDWGLKGRVKSFKETLHEPEQKTGKWEAGERRFYGNYRVNFDDKGRLVDIVYFDDYDKMSGRVVSVMEGGKVVEEVYYKKEDQLDTRTKINYLSKSEIEFEAFNSEGEKVRSGKTILKNGKMKEQTLVFYSNEDTTELTILSDYDKDGNLSTMKQLSEDRDTYVTLFEYLEFDKQGNWTKRLGYENGSLKDIYIREIEYY